MTMQGWSMYEQQNKWEKYDSVEITTHYESYINKTE
jgi:hypothetical protein